jgi:hypothetical protein
LRRAGYWVQLIEEQDQFLISVAKAGVAQGNERLCPIEQRAAKIDGAWAAQILAGQISPISVIDRRIRQPLAAELRALTADRTLARVESSEHESVRVGPVEFAEGDDSATLRLEFDRAEAPDAKGAYRLIATVLSGELQAAGRLLGALFTRAGVHWQFELPAPTQFAGLVDTA